MGIGIAGLDACIISKFPPVVRGEFSVKGTPQKLVVFFRSQIHSYAYPLVSVRRHNQHVRSPIQGFFGARESASSPALNKDQRSHGRLVARARNTQIIPKPPRRCQFPRGGFCARLEAQRLRLIDLRDEIIRPSDGFVDGREDIQI